MNLAALPKRHRLRNTPLFDIGARYQLTTKGTMWHEVRKPYGIAQKTYNELGEVWIKNHVWEASSMRGLK